MANRRLLVKRLKAVRNIRKMTVFDGVWDALEAVEALGLRNAVFTGRGRVSTDVILRELQLGPRFEMVVTNDDVQKHKPHPEGIFKICTELGVDVARAVMVGDSNADVRCGRDAGCRTVGIRWSPHSAMFHSGDNRPDRVADKPADLVSWLRGFQKT
jgi:HAD superfamily hydrolase (TIGR01549 family)